MRQGTKAHIRDIIRLYRSGKSQYEVARELGVSQGTIAQRMRRAGVTGRSRWEQVGATIPVDEAVALYASGLNLSQVARQAGVTPPAIKYHLRKAGIAVRPDKAPGRSGSANPAWRGGRSKQRDGYIWLAVVGEKRRVPEHRVIMERTLGRSLKKGEIVHHLNGVRDDNRPENLTVTTLKDHEHYTYVKALQARIRQLESHSEN